MKKENGMILFWGGPYSNWYKSSFTFNGNTYNCSEQYMMHIKALLFNDVFTARAVMDSDDPRHQKKLGRLVKNFNPDTWAAIAVDLMVPALVEKFTQNKSLLAEILSTGNDLIVEASPYDKIWGIGLGEDDPRALDQSQWQGTNWLGIAIMKARDIIREQTHV
jgi:ribA/ribD-fused uncharacterized protein